MNKMIIIKYSEIALKGGNRSFFEKQLARNISIATGVPYRNILRKGARLYIFPKENELQSIIENLNHVIGICAFTPAYKTVLELDEIKTLILKIIGESKGIQSFRIKTHRVKKSFPLTSTEINQILGKTTQEQYPNLKVKLKHPDISISVEIRNEGAFIYSSLWERDCIAGFPVGTSGKGLLLLSGGIDSPVAGWLAMKRGMVVDAVYFDSFPFTSGKAMEKVFDLARVLSRWKQASVKVFVSSLTEIQKVISKNAPEQYWTVLFRRSMYHIASKLSKTNRYQALITGDSLAQVASQTLENIATIGQAADRLILRPLISYDKLEIIKVSKKIGTFDISIRPYEDCCSLFTPKKPKTKTKLANVLGVEKKLCLEPLEQEAAQNTKIFTMEF